MGLRKRVLNLFAAAVSAFCIIAPAATQTKNNVAAAHTTVDEIIDSACAFSIDNYFFELSDVTVTLMYGFYNLGDYDGEAIITVSLYDAQDNPVTISEEHVESCSAENYGLKYMKEENRSWYAAYAQSQEIAIPEEFLVNREQLILTVDMSGDGVSDHAELTFNYKISDNRLYFYREAYIDKYTKCEIQMLPYETEGYYERLRRCNPYTWFVWMF